MPETKYHVEVTTVSGKTYGYNNCNYTIHSTDHFVVHTAYYRTITFLGNFTVTIISMEDFKESMLKDEKSYLDED